jgi:hypothetical protein
VTVPNKITVQREVIFEKAIARKQEIEDSWWIFDKEMSCAMGRF